MMATVRFSQELKDMIVKNAEAMFAKQALAAQESRPSHEWGMKIYDTLFSEYIPAINAMPAHFLKQVQTITVEHIGDTHCGLGFDLPTKCAWPHEFIETDIAKRNGYYGDEITLKHHLVWGELFAEIKAWQGRMAAVREQKNTFVTAVKQVLEAHATLAPALKMWPPLWDLVPETYKEKHREVKERTKREVEVSVDLGQMTAVAAFIKMTK
jgi:hypothetical protein